MKISLLHVVTLWLAVMLSGCMSMPVGTMLKMSQFSPMDIEPAGLRLAIRTDQAIKIEQGAVYVKFGFETEGTDKLPPVSRNHQFNVQVLPDLKAGYSALLFDDIESNETVTVLKLSDQDARIMQQAQSLIKQYKDADADVKGHFSLGMQNKCFGNVESFETLDVDLFLRTSMQDDYFLFLENVDIIEQAKEHNVNLQQVNKC